MCIRNIHKNTHINITHIYLNDMARKKIVETSVITMLILKLGSAAIIDFWMTFWNKRGWFVMRQNSIPGRKYTQLVVGLLEVDLKETHFVHYALLCIKAVDINKQIQE